MFTVLCLMGNTQNSIVGRKETPTVKRKTVSGVKDC